MRETSIKGYDMVRGVTPGPMEKSTMGSGSRIKSMEAVSGKVSKGINT